MITTIRMVLQMVGLATIVWFIWVACEEYRKVRQEQKEKGNGQ